MTGWPDDTEDVRGQEGMISGYAPTGDGSAWSAAVWLPEVEEVWSFDEDDLESTGFVELEDGDVRTRVALDSATHAESFGGEVNVKLLTEVEADDAPRVVAAAEAALRALIPIERLSWKGEVHWHPPYRYDINLELTPVGDSREAFESLVAARATGWVRQVDDGWSCDFWWSRDDDETGEPFLVPEADHVSVSLTPWSDPSSRPIRKGRTHDPGLPGFTPPPPVAGYENDE
jgi:hypothetical protein